MSEHHEQAALFEIARLHEAQYPDLELLFAIPNGGHRNIVTAAKMKREGVKRGVLDICLPVPKGKYHGFYGEMKVGRNKPTTEQQWWITQLSALGYRVELAYSAEEMFELIVEYLRRG